MVHNEWVRNGSETVITSWTFFWLVVVEESGSQHHQPSGFNQSGAHLLVVSISLFFSTLAGASDKKKKKPTCQCRQWKSHGFNPWVWKIPRVGNGNPLQYSCLENPVDRGAWWATVHRDAEADMTEQLSTVRVSVSSKQLKDIVIYMLWGEPGPTPKAALLLPDCSFLVFQSPPFPN